MLRDNVITTADAQREGAGVIVWHFQQLAVVASALSCPNSPSPHCLLCNEKKSAEKDKEKKGTGEKSDLKTATLGFLGSLRLPRVGLTFPIHVTPVISYLS